MERKVPPYFNHYKLFQISGIFNEHITYYFCILRKLFHIQLRLMFLEEFISLGQLPVQYVRIIKGLKFGADYFTVVAGFQHQGSMCRMNSRRSKTEQSIGRNFIVFNYLFLCNHILYYYVFIRIFIFEKG